MLDHSPNHSSSATARPVKPSESGHDLNVPDLPKMSIWAILSVLAVLAVLVVCGFLLGWIPHSRRQDAAKSLAEQAATAKPLVDVVRAREAAKAEDLMLPADVRAFRATAVFARASGYLTQLPTPIEIGDHVKEGQVIAIIAAPEVDAQLDRARAALDMAKAAVGASEAEYNLAVTTFQRYDNPTLNNAVSRQERDARSAQVETTKSALSEAQTNVAVAEAEVKRLATLQAFTRVYAPFDGVVTARNFDPGALIASSDAPSGKPLFMIENIQTLRVNVNVPQTYATDLQPGTPASLLVSNFPKREFEGKVARTAGSIDAATRTLRVEVDVPNPTSELIAGMYGQVRFRVQRVQPRLLVPASTIILGASGEHVAVVEGSRVRLRPVRIGRDFGSEVEISEGLTLADEVVVNPGTLADGTEVEIHQSHASQAAIAAPK